MPHFVERDPFFPPPSFLTASLSAVIFAFFLYFTSQEGAGTAMAGPFDTLPGDMASQNVSSGCGVRWEAAQVWLSHAARGAELPLLIAPQFLLLDSQK